MKTESMAFGIAGGALSFFFAMILILIGSAVRSMVSSEIAQTITIPDGLLALIGAVIGIIGAVLAGHKRKLAGVLMLVGAAANFIDMVALGASVFLAIGGVLALWPNNSEQSPHSPLKIISLVLCLLGGVMLLWIVGLLAKSGSLFSLAPYGGASFSFSRLLGAFVGTVGGALIFRKSALAGILMLVGAAAIFLAATDLVDTMSLCSCILFVAGGVLALIPEKTKLEQIDN